MNLSFGATENEIKKSFRRLASIHHPDKNGGSKNSEETFKVILNAYEILIDKDKRSVYDLQFKQRFQQKADGYNPTYSYSTIYKEEKKISSLEKIKLKIIDFFYSKFMIRFLTWLIILALFELITFIFNIFSSPNEKTEIKVDNKTEIINQPFEKTNPSNEIRPETGEITF